MRPSRRTLARAACAALASAVLVAPMSTANATPITSPMPAPSATPTTAPTPATPTAAPSTQATAHNQQTAALSGTAASARPAAHLARTGASAYASLWSSAESPWGHDADTDAPSRVSAQTSPDLVPYAWERGRGVGLSETNRQISARRCPRCSPRRSRSSRRPCAASGRSSRSDEPLPRRAAP